VALLYDTESNGFLEEATKLHCLNIAFPDGHRARFNNQKKSAPSIETGLKLLEDADMTVAHNAIRHDVPLIKKLYPKWKPRGIIRDTLVYSQLIYTNLKDQDFAYLKKHPAFPKNLIGRHSLESWGHRLGEYKGDFKGPWEEWTPEMDDYCDQDTAVLQALWAKMLSKKYSEEAIALEHDVVTILFRQYLRGFKFNEAKAHKLVATLQKKRLGLEEDLKRTFTPWFVNGGEFTPKRDDKKKGYAAGVVFCKTKLREFNPSSRDHMADRLTTLYGWRPVDMTPEGKPKVDETILSALNYPPAQLLTEYLTVEKRLGQIAEGKEAWLKHAKNGFIHCHITSNGAVTGRMSHSRPNLSQTPASYSPYGPECRELFEARPGFVLVGIDAAALELRDLGGYMARWDNGAYITAVLGGQKEDGTDPHSLTMKALLIKSRDVAKTWFYAFIYGAGDFKLGVILLEAIDKAKRPKGKQGVLMLGRASRTNIAKNIPALGKFIDAVKKKAKSAGHLRGLDGRLLHIRSDHSAPNTLLQGAGAVQMKKALVILDDLLQRVYSLRPGVEYEFVMNSHDEWQIETLPNLADIVGKAGVAAITKAGEYFKFRCPLDGEYKIGATWAETH
jgi:DNA polymerase I-like protein with 3'-5' exonuclease and polymerase domains